MRKFLVLILFVFSAVFAYSQSLSFSEKLHNFGTILEENGKVKHTFVITNNSKKPFIINYVTTGCGCTGAIYDKSPIMPSKNREMIVEYDPLGRMGLFRTAINIVGASPREDYVLHVIGNIVPRKQSILEQFPMILSSGVRISSDQMSFGALPTNESHANFIKLYNESGKTIKLDVKKSNIENTNSWFTRQTIRNGEFAYLMYEIALNDKNFIGAIQDELHIYIDGVKQSKNIKVSATIVGNFMQMTSDEVSASGVATFDTKSKHIDISGTEPVSVSFEIENTGSGDIEILKAIPRNEALSFSKKFDKLAAGQKSEVILTLNPQKLSSKKDLSVALIFSSPHCPIITLKLTTNK